MAKYIKDKAIEFRLANYEVIEEFLIWPAWGKKKDEVINPDTTQPYKFPIREGSDIKGTDGQIRRVGDDLRYMKLIEFQKLYPNMMKSTKFVREILVNNELFLYRFCATVNNELLKTLAMLKGVGKDPLSVLFKQTYDSSQSPLNKYKLTIVGESVSKPTIPNANIAIDTSAATIPKQEGLVLDEKETAVYNAISNLGIEIPEEKFIKVYVDNKVPEARAKQIYAEKYKK